MKDHAQPKRTEGTPFLFINMYIYVPKNTNFRNFWGVKRRSQNITLLLFSKNIQMFAKRNMRMNLVNIELSVFDSEHQTCR